MERTLFGGVCESGTRQKRDLESAGAVLKRTQSDLVISKRKLREIEGMTYEEIAETMELPLSTVKTRLFRARQQLKRALEAWR